jgi:hypothetical protein
MRTRPFQSTNSLSLRSWSIEGLTRLQVNVGKLTVKLLYLLLGERLEDVHQGKEPYSFFQWSPTLSYFLTCQSACILGHWFYIDQR